MVVIVFLIVSYTSLCLTVERKPRVQHVGFTIWLGNHSLSFEMSHAKI